MEFWLVILGGTLSLISSVGTTFFVDSLHPQQGRARTRATGSDRGMLGVCAHLANPEPPRTISRSTPQSP